MQYQLIRSKRASISLQVIAGKVVVRAPLSVKTGYIEKLLVNKSAWIDEKVTKQLIDQTYQNQLCANGQIWFDGKLCPLDVTFGLKNHIEFTGSSIELTVKANNVSQGNVFHDELLSAEVPQYRIKKTLERWLKCQAEDYLIPQAEYFSQKTALTPKNITIRQYKARWGSCNSLGNMQFNYLLMMAPKWVVNYVIVHELCHLQHLNHSPQFWTLVEQYYPNYRLAKQWLKTHQHKLQWAI